MSTADVLRPLWLAGITECKGARKTTIETFLIPKIAHLNSLPVQGGFTIFVANQKMIPELFSHEADRFSTAAFESLLVETTKPEFPRSIGWILIRGYYSAFFALHSLMRLHGWACTRLPKDICTRLNKDASLYFPGGNKIEAGLYLIKACNRNPELSFQYLGGKGGGSHEALWSLLFGFMKELTNVAMKNPVDAEAAQELVRLVSQFRELVNGNGGTTWLTKVRNRVNYSHGYGAWHPYQQSTCDVDRIINVLSRWKDQPSVAMSTGTSDELLQFCEACAFLISLCHSTMKDLIYRSKPTSPFRLSTGRLLDKI